MLHTNKGVWAFFRILAEEQDNDSVQNRGGKVNNLTRRAQDKNVLLGPSGMSFFKGLLLTNQNVHK